MESARGAGTEQEQDWQGGLVPKIEDRTGTEHKQNQQVGLELELELNWPGGLVLRIEDAKIGD